MNKFNLYLFLVLFIFFINCSSTNKELLLDSFEGEVNKESVDFGASSGSSVVVMPSPDLKVCGKQAMLLKYDLKPSGYMWVARGYNLDVKGADKWLVKPFSIDWSKYNAFSFFMYGSNSLGVVAFDIKDRGGEIWRFIVDDDFVGWKEIVCPFSQFFLRRDWQPDNALKNEILDYPIMSFQFEPRLPGKGSYYFDCVKLKKVKMD
ncbi:MAG: hypothetical protein NC904_06490 [Candidatus Omnitrophica bacterium]|nr:hypothetical protein [Candidatus Omnitrophota bacterium]